MTNEKHMTTAIETQQETPGLSVFDRIQDPIQAAETLGNWFTRSGLFGCDKTEQGNMLALVCLLERKSPTEITRNYDIVQGRLRKKAMALHADFRARGGSIRWINTGDEGKEATAEFAFEGQTVTLRYGIEQAKAAGLVKSKSAWETNPGNMLRARLLSNGIGMLCPEILAGESEEIEHAPAEPAAPLNFAKYNAKPAPVEQMPKPKPAKAAPAVVDVEPEPEPEPVKQEETKAAPVATSSGLDTETQIQLGEAMQAAEIDMVVAQEYARAQKWITPDQDLTDIPLAKARRIINQAPSFKRALDNWKGGAK